MDEEKDAYYWKLNNPSQWNYLNKWQQRYSTNYMRWQY